MTRASLVLVLVGVGCQAPIDVALWQTDRCRFDQKVCATVAPQGDDRPTCGATRIAHGEVVPQGHDTWIVGDCGGCMPCARTQTITFHAPRDWAPSVTPRCARVEIAWSGTDAAYCPWTGTTIWAEDEAISDPHAPIYVARSLVALEAVPVPDWTVAPVLVEEKACKGDGCCSLSPGKYAFAFDGLGWSEPLTLQDGEHARGVLVGGVSYDLRNMQSHVHEACDALPHLDWVARRSLEPPMEEPDASSGDTDGRSPMPMDDTDAAPMMPPKTMDPPGPGADTDTEGR